MSENDNKLQENSNYFFSNRLQNIVRGLSKWKTDFINEVNENKRLRDINIKLEVSVKEARELERSNRVQLSTAHEMIDNLQETVSQLVYLKRDLKKLKDEARLKDTVISNLEKEIENLSRKHNELENMRHQHEKHLEDVTTINERKIAQVKLDAETQIAESTCVIAELKSKIKEMEVEHSDKMNVVVLENEEKIQRGLSQVRDLQDQLARQAACADANVKAYRRRLEELEEKLKQNQFKNFLAQNTSSLAENHVERPYSEMGPYETIDLEPAKDMSKLKIAPPTNAARNTLQVTYRGRTQEPPNAADEKGKFVITKKRKLYTEKNFMDF